MKINKQLLGGKYKLSNFQFFPFSISFIYLFTGTIYFLFFNLAIIGIFNSRKVSVFFQIVAGEIFVGASTILIFTWIKTWKRNEEKQHEKIETANQRLQVLYRLFRHNMRNNLNILLLTLEQAKREINNDKIRDQIENAKNRIKEMTKISKDVSNLEKLIRQGKEKNQININNLIDEIVSSFKEKYPDVNFSIQSNKNDLNLYISGYILEIALDHTIENGIIHNDLDSEDKKIDIKIEEEPEFINLKITDNGPGIPKEELEPIRKGKETQLEHTSKLGLWSIYWSIRSIKGKLEFKENKPRGTTVSMKLPKDQDTKNILD